MSKQQLIVLDKINPNQLPELANFKEKGFSLLKECSFIKIEDNLTYEIAKKHRTALKSYRTDVQKSEKAIKDKINSFKNKVQIVSAELIEITQIAENKQQSEITAWEDKKEQERLEKVRLEQERIDGIKNSIKEFGEVWEKAFSLIKFENIEEAKSTFKESVSVVNSSEFQEFEVLFTDKVSYLENVLYSKIKTLTEQEEIRLEQIRLTDERKKQEEESKRIAEAQRVEREKFEAEQKAIAEQQRIAQEKFQKEKAEFEAKQLEAKYQERKKFLVDEDYWRIYLLAECGDFESNAKLKLLTYTDETFEDFKLAVLKAKEPIIHTTQEVDFEEVKIDEIAQEQARLIVKDDVLFDTNLNKNHEASNEIIKSQAPISGSPLVDYHELDVDPKGIQKEVTWESILEEFNESGILRSNTAFIDWLNSNYSVPNKKQ